MAASSSELIQNQGVGIQEATKVRLHDRRDMGITGNDSMGGVDLPRQRLPSLKSHIQQLGKLKYILLCAISNNKNTEAEYDLGLRNRRRRATTGFDALKSIIVVVAARYFQMNGT